MAATVDIIKTYGTTGAPTEVTNTTPGLLSTNDNSATADSPVTIPGVGTNYSYECWMRFKIGATAPDNQCTNFKIWSSGSAVGTGLVITVNTDAVTSFVTPVNTQSAQGTRASFATKDSSSKVAVGGTLVSTGDKSDFSVFQLEVGTTAGPGDVTYTVNYSYDES